MIEQLEKDKFIKNARESFLKIGADKIITDLFVDFLSNTYEIFFEEKEPAEPKVLTAGEMFEKSRKINNNIIEYGESMHQNGRLERDLELRDATELIKEVASFYHNVTSFLDPVVKDNHARAMNNILHVAKNLKPLRAE